MGTPPLSHAAAHRVRAAQGWYELGDCRSALEELRAVEEAYQEHPLVLMLLWHVHAKAAEWAACVEVGYRITNLLPESPFGWVNLCNALYFRGEVQLAYDTLRPLLDKFPRNEMMHYNLACYACQLGRLEEARQWLDQAFALDTSNSLQDKAKEDPDLAPLHQDGGASS